VSTQNFEIVDLPPSTLVGLSADFYGAMSPKFNGQEVLGPIWGKVHALGAALQLPKNSRMISATGPSNNDLLGEGLLTQFIGFEVQTEPAEIGELSVFQVPGGKYATIQHVGSMDTLVQSIQDFYGQVLPGAGCTQANGLHLEIYDERYNETQNSIMTIAAPIK
jgi:predicted transcriptional regulator YdeE